MLIFCISFNMKLALFRLSILASALVPVSAYVTSPNAVPVNLQIKYLKQLTTKLVEAPEGELSDSQVATSHELMYAWSHLPPAPAPERSMASCIARIRWWRRTGRCRPAPKWPGPRSR